VGNFHLLVNLQLVPKSEKTPKTTIKIWGETTARGIRSFGQLKENATDKSHKFALDVS
jgi:hypothetical protein